MRDPLGGINSLWPLFGIANQLLAAIALCVATTILLKMHGARYMWITCVPLAWLVTVTFTAGMAEDLLAAAGDRLSGAGGQAGSGAAARARRERAATQTLIFNARLDAAVCGVFLVLVAVILVDSVRVWAGILRGTREARVHEAPFVLSQLRRRNYEARSVRLVLALLRELADENAYQRHLAAHGRTHSRRRMAAILRGAAAREIRAREVLLKILRIGFRGAH